MFYNDYEDYMRNVLGYTGMNTNTYQQYDNNYNNMQFDTYQVRNELYDIERMYPEIYRIINPMVCTACNNNNQPVNEQMLEQMTNDIYDNVVNRVEIQNIVNLNIETRETRDSENKDCKDCSRINNTKTKEKQEDRSPVPRRRNRLLTDLIRILLLNQLIRPNRPPFRPGPPPRPGFPPIGPGGRPPFNPNRPGQMPFPNRDIY